MPLNINIQQVLLHMFNFVLLFGISYFLLYGPVKKFMDSRKKYYEDMDEAARENLEMSEKMRADYETKLSNVGEEIDTLKSEAVKEASERREEIVKNAREEAKAIVEEARKQSELEHERSVTSAKQEIEAYVSKAAEEIVKEKDPYASFLDAAKKDSNNE